MENVGGWFIKALHQDQQSVLWIWTKARRKVDEFAKVSNREKAVVDVSPIHLSSCDAYIQNVDEFAHLAVEVFRLLARRGVVFVPGVECEALEGARDGRAAYG